MVTADNLKAHELEPLQWPCGQPLQQLHPLSPAIWLHLTGAGGLYTTSFW